MSGNLIFAPVLIQILLTIAGYIGLAIAKASAVKNKQVNEARRGLYDDAWPERVIQINNNIRNQFELPVLFYALCFMLWALQAVTTPALIIAWLFVISRLLHAYIHTGSNYVPLRRNVFMFATLMVLIMTLMVSLALFQR